MKKQILMALAGFMCLQVGPMLYAMQTSEMERAIEDAVIFGNVAQVKRLIKEGAPVNFETEGGYTLLQLSMTFLDRRKETSREEITKLLIKAGADTQSYDSRGVTPLHFALQESNLAAIRELIENGADIHAPAKYKKPRKDQVQGETPLDIALRKKEPQSIRVLIATLSPKEVQHVIPAIIALQKSKVLGGDIGGLIAKQLIPEIVREKLALARRHLPNVPEDQLQQEIVNSINRVISNSPKIQAAKYQLIKH